MIFESDRFFVNNLCFPMNKPTSFLRNYFSSSLQLHKKIGLLLMSEVIESVVIVHGPLCIHPAARCLANVWLMLDQCLSSRADGCRNESLNGFFSFRREFRQLLPKVTD